MNESKVTSDKISTVMAWFVVASMMLPCASITAAVSVWLFQSVLQVLP